MTNGNGQPIVGRRAELGALGTALSRITRRRATWLAVSGEPGIGKTRLLRELGDRADAESHLVLEGRAAEFERELPFAVWIDALDAYLAGLNPARVQRLAGEQLPELARVLPAAAADAETPAAGVQDERFRAYRAVRSLLEGLAREQPVVLVLDDLHWADDASLELLAHMLRRPPRGQVLGAVAFRAGQIPNWVAAALEAAARDSGVTELELAPLSAEEADALLGGEIAAGVRADLYRQSGGNPFYLTQLARARGRTLSPDAPAAGDDAVPPAVAAALGQEIAAVSEPARRLARGAAVAGEPVELELAAAVAQMPEPEGRAALDELLASGLLAVTDVPRRYRFRHPLVRHAVYEGAGEAWRVDAHARAAAALEARTAPAAARAHHLERCAAPGDEAAIAVLVQAGLEIAPRAPAGAAQWFDAALRLLPEDADPGRRLGLLVPLATALASTGRLERALATLLDALALVPPELAEVRVRLIAACAACENLLGRHDAAHRRLLLARDELPEGSAAAGALYAELAADGLYHSDFATVREWAQRARDAARALDDPGLGALAAGLLCFAGFGLGDTPAAQAARADGASLLDGLPDDALAARLDAPYYLGFAEYFCDAYDDTIRHLRRGIEVSRNAGQGQFVIPMMVGLAHALEKRGRLQEARETVEGAVEAARMAGNRQVAGWALFAEGWIAAMAGDFDRALRAGEDALEAVRGLDESLLTRATHDFVAAIWLEAGQPDRCLEQARSLGPPELPLMEPGRRAWLYAVLVRAELERGNRRGAEDWLERAEATARGLGLSLVDASVLHARALLALAAGEAATAAELAERAAAAADEVGVVVDAARARTVAGRALAAAGEGDRALEVLRRAEEELGACGATRFRDEAARELRRLGQRVSAPQRRSKGSEGLEALSGRELQVAELVAQGHTNREIAGELYLSEKTIETHLSRVFSKLRVSSRAAVAEAVGRSRADEP